MVAWNLLHDGRIAPELTAAFKEFARSTSGAEPIKNTLLAYFEDRVRGAAKPDFLDVHLNGSNILSRRAFGDGRPAQGLELVRVVDLCGLADVLRASRFVKRIFDELPPRTDHARLIAWLDDFLDWNGTAGPRFQTRAEQLVTAVLEALAWYRARHSSYHPSWCTVWSQFEPFAAAGAARWAEVIGIPGRHDTWLVGVKYRVEDVGDLCRPTQLHAGYNEYHFPVPPVGDARQPAHGHPVDLGAMKPDRLLSEFIHQQIDHTIEHWLGERLIGRRSMTPSSPLVDRRRRHYDLMTDFYTETVVKPWTRAPL
jgi:hypothetical protein